MKKIKITAIRKANYTDLQQKYELFQENPCCVNENDTWVVENCVKPSNFCEIAWKTLEPFVISLSNGEEKIYGDWMKNPASALISCNDGFRPVSFLIEVIE
jgi:uncharacterized repeat protein (TIGR04076 family)